MAGRQVNMYLQEKTYIALREFSEVGKFSQYINQALEEKLDREREMRKEKLRMEMIDGYKFVANNKKLKEELEVWDQAVGDGLDDE